MSALSRPLISKKLVEIAHKTGATTIAHGCTGKGNDQVRFEVSIASLDPKLKVIAPVREWKWSREEEINYAKANGVPIPADLDSPYSVDQNLWGRANECGVLENPWNEAPEDAYDLTVAPEAAPDSPAYVNIDFEAGVPVALDGKKIKLADLILELNDLAGQHGVGRIDHVENRLVGIKSREIYECPGAITLLAAHKEIEDFTIITVGDNMNDVELLQEADYGFCISNGSEELKRKSKYIAPSNDENPIEFIVKWIQKLK